MLLRTLVGLLVALMISLLSTPQVRAWLYHHSAWLVAKLPLRWSRLAMAIKAPYVVVDGPAVIRVQLEGEPLVPAHYRWIRDRTRWPYSHPTWSGR